MLVRFVNNSGKWINVQNGTSGTPQYNTGLGGWTIHYVYAVEVSESAPDPEPEPVTIKDPSEFVNGKLYTFVTQRGAMGASESSDYAISTARVPADTNSDYFKWTVYKSDKENYYLYNLGKKQFLGVQSADKNASVPMSDTPAKVTFKKGNLSNYPIIFTTLNDGKCVANHSPNFGEGLITWNGGWTDLNDTGNGHCVTEIDDLGEDVLALIVQAVNAFELDNTTAKNNLGTAISNAQTLFSNITIGNAMGEYTSSNPNYLAEFQAIVDYYNAITSTSTPTPEEINVKIDELNAIVGSFSINQPKAGNYYRLKGNSGNYIDASSLYDASSRQMAMKSEGECNLAGTIFLLDGNSLLNYATGTYTRNTREIGVVGDATKSAWTFSQSPNTFGKYALTDNATAGSKNLHDNAGTRADRCSSNCGVNHDFIIEEVAALPVVVGEEGKATLYAPVALEIPANVKAYTVAVDGEWANLTEVKGGIIPANTGVVVVADAGTYSFTITSTENTETSALRGTVASEYVTADAYVLGVVDGTVGFYRAVTDGQSDGTFLNNGHKAYLPKPAGAGSIASYGVRYDGTTGIEEIRTEKAKVIFDLTGRRIESITAPGIYIVNGKKVLVK